jgi:O-methyltransferase
MSGPSLPLARRIRSYINGRVGSALEKRGYVIDRIVPRDVPAQMEATIRAVRPYTATSVERIMCLIESVHYLERYRISGDIVECGVYRGGSVMAAALTLLDLKSFGRHLYLFDTFEGMPDSGKDDVDSSGVPAREQWETARCYAGLDEVRKAVLGTGYPEENVHFIKGMVEDTVPAQSPEAIALLRLDTDWYQSTKHELIHLYPRLVDRGVLILDDYGHWQGARKAVDEFVATLDDPILLHRIDRSGRVAIKTACAPS